MDRKRPITLKDVAEQVDVSPYTASVVLNGAKSNTRVSEATRERIIQAAEELGYRPNGLARALRTQQTNIIGLYFGYGSLEPHDPFHAEVLTGLQRGCEATEKDLMIHYSFHRYGTDEVFNELVSGKIDGLVLLADASDPLVPQVRSSALPVVAMTDALEGIPSVIADDAKGSRMIVNHLVKKGHKAVIYRMCPGASDSASRRHAAFVEAAVEHGIAVHEGRTEDWKGRLSRQEQNLIANRAKHGITAAVCWGDPSANALLSYCRKSGIQVPGDLAIVGFNGIESSVEPAQRLTTIHAHWAEVAERAVSILVDRIANRIVPLWTVLPVEFVAGDTT